MNYAIQFAETGHLCVATLHANSANQALDRIINFFPEERRHQLLMDLSLNITAMISQRLLPRENKMGRIAAMEIMLASPLISDLIFRGEVAMIKDIMAKSTRLGMQTFDQALFQLYEDGAISYEEAMRNADSKNELRLKIKLQSKREGTASAEHAESLQLAEEEKEAGSKRSDRNGSLRMNVKPLFKLMVDKKASDLFFTTYAPVMIKIDGKIMPVNQVELTPKMVRQAALELMNEQQLEQFTRDLEIDFAISEARPRAVPRQRIPPARQRRDGAAVHHAELPQLDELGMPEIIKDMIMLRRGLILMVGASGSGKSTTLGRDDRFPQQEFGVAHRHDRRPDRVPAQQPEVDRQSARGGARHVVLPPRAAQRDARSARRHPDRRDPRPRDDASRDRPCGHRPSWRSRRCTRTTRRRRSTASSTCIPNDQHKQVLMDLSQYVRVIISQRLVRSKEGKRVAAVEIMLNTPHISELILKGDISNVKEAFKDTKEPGMQSFDQALFDLYRRGAISMEEALSNADSRVEPRSQNQLRLEESSARRPRWAARRWCRPLPPGRPEFVAPIAGSGPARANQFSAAAAAVPFERTAA